MKREDYLKILAAAFISLLSLAMLTSNTLNVRNIIGSSIMAIGVGVIAWLGKRRPIAMGIWVGTLLFALIFGYIAYMGWFDKA